MLVLFDIDGTLLLRASVEHAAAMHTAIRAVYGIEPARGGVEAAGRTDFAIARSILTLAGVDDQRISDGLGDLRAGCCEEFARVCPDDLSGHLAPGATETLELLAARDGVVLSLVTGNLEPIARLKLQRAGIGKFFESGQGGFGSDSEDRAALPPLARARAGRDGEPYPRERTFVVGDTPRDIACARADGVRCVAVTTGPFGVAELAQADAVIDSLERLPGVLYAL